MIQPSLAEIYSGIYTATVTGVTNCTGTATTNCQYMKVGNVVTVSGRFFVQATVINAFTEANISLPISSDITSPEQCGGTAMHNNGTTMFMASIRGNVSTNVADIYLSPSNTSNNVYYFHFTYQVK